MAIELDLNSNPPVKTYNHHAFGTGIITTTPEGMNYIYNNYIQLVYYPKAGKFSFEFYMDYIYCHPVFDRESITQETFDAMGMDAMSYITNAILAGKYVVMCVNEYYIPDREAYLSYSFMHNILIYGYDEKKKVFLTAGYNADGHFATQALDRKIIKKASPKYIILLRRRDDYDYVLKPEWIRYQIDAYYGKREQPPLGAYTAPGRYIGEEAISLMMRDMSAALDDLSLLDVRPFTLLEEHGRLMLERVRILCETGFSSDAEVAYWEQEYDRRKILLKRIYMYNVRCDEKSANKVRERMEEKIEREF